MHFSSLRKRLTCDIFSTVGQNSNKTFTAFPKSRKGHISPLNEVRNILREAYKSKVLYWFSFNLNATSSVVLGVETGIAKKRMRRNSILIPSHMNPTCSTVKSYGIIMMSEFSPSAGQQLALLATLRRLTHVAFSTRAPNTFRTLSVSAT